MKTVCSEVLQLCNQVLNNHFDTFEFVFEEKGVLSCINKPHTALIKIKKDGWINEEYKPLVLHSPDVHQGECNFVGVSNKLKKEFLKGLTRFDKDLFNDKLYTEVTDLTPLRKLMMDINEYDVYIEAGKNRAVYNTTQIKPVLLNYPTNLRLHINPQNEVLHLNYDFYGYDIYCAVASKIVPYSNAEAIWVVE